MSNIITTNEPAPSEDRRFDWCARLDDYAPGDIQGFGESKAQAIADLQAQRAAAADEVVSMLETWHELVDALRLARGELVYLRDHRTDMPAGHLLVLHGLFERIDAVLLKAEGE